MFDFAKNGTIPEPVMRKILSRKFAQEVSLTSHLVKCHLSSVCLSVTKWRKCWMNTERGTLSATFNLSLSSFFSHFSPFTCHISLVPVTSELWQADTIEEMLGEYRARHAKSDPETPEEEQYIDYRSREKKAPKLQISLLLQIVKNSLQEVCRHAGGVKHFLKMSLPLQIWLDVQMRNTTGHQKR